MTIHILHCINSFSPLSGGVGFALKEFCEGLSDFNHTVFALKDSEPTFESDALNLRLFDRNGPFTLSYSIDLEKALMRHVSNNPDTILHIHGLWSGLDHSINVLRRKHPELNYIVSSHGMLAPIALKRRRMVKAIMSSIWLGPMIENSFAVHCLTANEEKHVQSFSSVVNTFIQPHAIDFPFTENELIKIWSMKKKQKKTLLYIGRIHRTKGVVELVKAMEERAQVGLETNFGLIIAGIGQVEAIAEIKKITKASIADVTFIGPAFGEKKRRLLLDAHGLILPSMTEGLPMTLMEGMSCGLPLFVTHECNLDWVSEQGAGVSLPYSAANIAGLLDAFNSTPIKELSQMGLSGAKQARQIYTSEVITKNWRELYERAKQK